MARYTGPDTKLKRRFRLLPNSATADTRSRGRQSHKSTYGVRLEEKQKLRYIYGILEKQFRRYFNQARKDPSNTGYVLMQILEQRLDNVVYRLGFAPTRRAARQLVNHGHVLVNDKKVDIPSCSVSVGDVISLKPKALEFVPVKESIAKLEDNPLPSWLGREGLFGVVKSQPSEDDVRTDIDLQLIIEYYSR